MFLVNSRERSFAAGLLHCCKRSGHIPKVRPLFCRVPERTLSRTPWDSLPIHLCRFTVRSPYDVTTNFFLTPWFMLIFLAESSPVFRFTAFTFHLLRGKNAGHRSSGFAWNFILHLGSANPGRMILAQEPLDIRWTWFSHVYILLIPTFLLACAPGCLTTVPSTLHATLLYR